MSAGDAFERPGDDGPLCGRQLGLQSEATALVRVPPSEEPVAIGIHVVRDVGPGGEVTPAPDGSARDTLRPHDQPRLVLGRREPCELHDLVDPELARAEGLPQARQGPQGARGHDPTARPPFRDPVAHAQPVSRVARAVAFPVACLVETRDQHEEVEVRRADARVGRVDVVEHVFEPTERTTSAL